jgi:putative Holliday junction resolvase
MGRIVAIDYGTKRVGIATTDPLQMIASPLDTVHSKDVINFLKEYNAREEIEAFVVGMPKNLQNEDTNATIHVKQFVVVLKKTFPEKEVHLMDERFTSKMALQAMITGQGKKRKPR